MVSFNANLVPPEPINGTLAPEFTFPWAACNDGAADERRTGEPIGPRHLRPGSNKYLGGRTKYASDAFNENGRLCISELPTSWRGTVESASSSLPLIEIYVRWEHANSSGSQWTIPSLPAGGFRHSRDTPWRSYPLNFSFRPLNVRPPSRLPKCFEIEFALAASIFIPHDTLLPFPFRRLPSSIPGLLYFY